MSKQDFFMLLVLSLTQVMLPFFPHIPGFRKELKEEDRLAIAATILKHLKLCL